MYDITDSVSFSSVSTWYNKAISVHYDDVPTFALFSNKCKYPLKFSSISSKKIKHVYIVNPLKLKKWLNQCHIYLTLLNYL